MFYVLTCFIINTLSTITSIIVLHIYHGDIDDVIPYWLIWVARYPTRVSNFSGGETKRMSDEKDAFTPQSKAIHPSNLLITEYSNGKLFSVSRHLITALLIDLSIDRSVNQSFIHSVKAIIFAIIML